MITSLRVSKVFESYPELPDAHNQDAIPLIVLEVDMMEVEMSFGHTGHQSLDSAP